MHSNRLCCYYLSCTRFGSGDRATDLGTLSVDVYQTNSRFASIHWQGVEVCNERMQNYSILNILALTRRFGIQSSSFPPSPAFLSVFVHDDWNPAEHCAFLTLVVGTHSLRVIHSQQKQAFLVEHALAKAPT